MQKKASLLAVYEILNKHTDEQHPLSRKHMEHLLSLNYDIVINRKTFHDHIQLLNDFGCDIQTPSSQNEGYYMAERLFEASEILLLCNAVYATRFIPEKASSDLIKKLLSTQSKYIKNDFDQTVYMKNMRKTRNKEFFLTVEILVEAIHKNHPVSFNYIRYNLEKQFVPRKEHAYIVHPYYIIYANENYYLICNHDHYTNLSHYRIDKMQKVTILDHMEKKPLGNSFHPYEYAKSKIYMYGGQDERITLKCDYYILDDIIDRFGNDVKLQPFDNQHFLAIVESSKQGIIFLCLQYLRYCEVTAPEELRTEIYTILKEAMNKYAFTTS